MLPPRLTPTRRTRLWAGLLLASLALAGAATAQSLIGPAEISLRRTDGAPLTTVELGDRLPLEVVVDGGAAEVTGFAFSLTYDSELFRLLEPDGSRTGASVAAPFLAGGWLQGVVLLNRVEVEEGQVYLSYVEAAGVQRQSVTGSGVAARFVLEAVRRPLGDAAAIQVVDRGHDRGTFYTTADRPGQERAFGVPLGSATARITGFKIRRLPDLTVVEGDGVQTVVPDLDTYVDQEGAQVLWSVSLVEALATAIDLDNGVTMDPRGIVGDTVVVFTAFEVEEGNADADTVRVQIRARPRIAGLPAQITFTEDQASTAVRLDDFVTDLDDAADQLTWSVINGTFVHVDIDAATRTAVFSAAADAFGQAQVRLVVQDASGLADTVTVDVVVTPVNDPPVVQRRGPVYPRLGAGGSVLLPLEELIVDPDDAADSLQILLQTEGGITASLTPDGSALELTGTATGRGLVRLTVQDRAGERDAGQVVAVVLPAGATLPPKISPLPQLRFLTGDIGTLELNRYVSDDGPTAALGWTPVTIPSLRPTVRDGVLVVTAASGYTGSSAVALVVTDADGNQDAASLAVTVLNPGQPQGPLISPPPKIGLTSPAVGDTAAAAVVIDLDPLVDDPDDDDEDLTWTVTASSGLTATYDPQLRQVRLTAAPGLSQIGSLTLTATDGDGLAHTRSIPVLAVEAGGAPLIDDLQPVVLDSADTVGRIDLDDEVFDDEDLESELEWTARAEPGIAVEIDPATHLLRVRRDGAAPGGPAAQARVVLTARDTRGQERSVILTIELPPLFQLEPIPDLVFFVGAVDTSLVLADYVDDAAVQWSVAPPTQLTAQIDAASTRVRVAAVNGAFIGTEVLRFTATDPTGRSRQAPVRVTVRGRGLAPQVRALPPLSVRAGETDRSLDLDDYVVDDDPDSTLTWSVGQPPDVTVVVDPLTHELSVRPHDTATGPRTAQLVVRDPAGNVAVGLVEIQVLRGGQAPVVGPLPQILLPAGGPEESLSLDLYVVDADTPDEQISWVVSAEPGVAARIDGRRLRFSVPAAQQGTRRVQLVASDPQGNRAEGTLVILIQRDDEAPGFAVQAERDPLLRDRLDLTFRPTEPLFGDPQAIVNGAVAEVTPLGDGSYRVSVAVPPVDAVQSVTVSVSGRDPAGNTGTRQAEISLRRVAGQGGTVSVDDGRVQLNIPRRVASPGRLAVLYRLAPEDLPAGVGAEPGAVYSVAVAGDVDLDHPVVLNLFAGGAAADPATGVERWDPATMTWQDVPSAADAGAGWLSASVRQPGLYRVGPVAEGERRPAASLANYPNPFNGAAGATRIEYEVSTAGPVRLELYSMTGQRVRVLVDEGQQSVGVWSADWDGRDEAGRQLASGIYLCRLQEPGATHLRRLLLLK